MNTPEQIDARLAQLSDLTAGWDGYRAGAIPRETIKACRVVAVALVSLGKHIAITPTSAETLAIEWTEGDLDCLADIDATRDAT